MPLKIDPQSYQGPVVRYAAGAGALRADAQAAGVTLYVHAPYPINVATSVRISRLKP